MHLAIQEHVWAVIGGSHYALIEIVVSELLEVAMNADTAPEKAESIADILVTLNSITVRGKLITRFRKVCQSSRRLRSQLILSCRASHKQAFAPLERLSITYIGVRSVLSLD